MFTAIDTCVPNASRVSSSSLPSKPMDKSLSLCLFIDGETKVPGDEETCAVRELQPSEHT